MIPFLMMLIYSLSRFATTMFRTSIQDGTKFYCLWPRSHLMIFWEVRTLWEYVSLINSKPYGNCMTWKFIRRCRGLIIRRWKQWWKEEKIRNFDHEILTPEMRELEQVQWLRVAGDQVVQKGFREFAINGKQRAVFERRQMQFPARQWWACKINTQNHSILWATSTKRYKRVEERDHPRSESNWEVQSTAVQRFLERYLH